MDATRKQKIYLVSFVTLVAVGVFLYTLIGALFDAPVSSEEMNNVAQVIDSATTSESLEEVLFIPPAELPVRLLVPALSIDAEVQYVGLTESGAMGIPTNYTDVAWYQHGTVPGQVGSAVIDGHVDNGIALPAVFKELDQLTPGDIVSVVTEEHTQLDFIVERIEEYPYEEMPLYAIFHTADAQRLNLITCAGDWIKDAKTYDQRLVVYTKLVEQEG